MARDYTDPITGYQLVGAMADGAPHGNSVQGFLRPINGKIQVIVAISKSSYTNIEMDHYGHSLPKHECPCVYYYEVFISEPVLISEVIAGSE